MHLIVLLLPIKWARFCGGEKRKTPLRNLRKHICNLRKNHGYFRTRFCNVRKSRVGWHSRPLQ